jgi:hypothetical protein
MIKERYHSNIDSLNKNMEIEGRRYSNDYEDEQQNT